MEVSRRLLVREVERGVGALNPQRSFLFGRFEQVRGGDFEPHEMFV